MLASFRKQTTTFFYERNFVGGILGGVFGGTIATTGLLPIFLMTMIAKCLPAIGDNKDNKPGEIKLFSSCCFLIGSGVVIGSTSGWIAEKYILKRVLFPIATIMTREVYRCANEQLSRVTVQNVKVQIQKNSLKLLTATIGSIIFLSFDNDKVRTAFLSVLKRMYVYVPDGKLPRIILGATFGFTFFNICLFILNRSCSQCLEIEELRSKNNVMQRNVEKTNTLNESLRSQLEVARNETMAFKMENAQLSSRIQQSHPGGNQFLAQPRQRAVTSTQIVPSVPGPFGGA